MWVTRIDCALIRADTSLLNYITGKLSLYYYVALFDGWLIFMLIDDMSGWLNMWLACEQLLSGINESWDMCLLVEFSSSMWLGAWFLLMTQYVWEWFQVEQCGQLHQQRSWLWIDCDGKIATLSSLFLYLGDIYTTKILIWLLHVFVVCT